MVEEIRIPKTVDATWIGSYNYEIVMAMNRIINCLNDIDGRLAKIERHYSCTCPQTDMMGAVLDCWAEGHFFQTSWMCPVHGTVHIGA